MSAPPAAPARRPARSRRRHAAGAAGPGDSGDLLGLEARFTHAQQLHARRVERLWRWPTVLVLLSTVPSFYLELLDSQPPLYATASYVLAALMMLAQRLHTGWRSGHLLSHLGANAFDLVLAAGQLACALAPPSATSTPALVLRLVVGFFTFGRMVWAAHYVITRGGILYRLSVAVAVLLMCGAGFRWLEPTTPTFGDGVWLAFITAATVGYGDVVPTTPASKIFAVFVVFLGVGAVTLATAAIASAWVESDERKIEREILHDLREQMALLHDELAALRAEVRGRQAEPGAPMSPLPTARAEAKAVPGATPGPQPP